MVAIGSFLMTPITADIWSRFLFLYLALFSGWMHCISMAWHWQMIPTYFQQSVDRPNSELTLGFTLLTTFPCLEFQDPPMVWTVGERCSRAMAKIVDSGLNAVKAETTQLCHAIKVGYGDLIQRVSRLCAHLTSSGVFVVYIERASMVVSLK
jgi:hypothetical protein